MKELKLVKWVFQGLTLWMVEIEGQLWASTAMLAMALGCTAQNIRKLYKSYADEFDAFKLGTDILSATTGTAKGKTGCATSSASDAFFEELRPHAKALGFQRLKTDAILWSEDDMITIAMLSRSVEGKNFRRELRRLAKETAAKNYVTREEHEALLQRLAAFEALIGLSVPGAKRAASAAGSALAAQRLTKPLREMN